MDEDACKNSQVMIARRASAAGKTMYQDQGTLDLTYVIDQKRFFPDTHPQLIIEKQGPTTAVVGQTFSYTITIRNAGGTNATNVALTDTLPTGLSYVDSNPTADPHDGTVTWNDLGTSGPGYFHPSVEARTRRIRDRLGVVSGSQDMTCDTRRMLGEPTLRNERQGLLQHQRCGLLCGNWCKLPRVNCAVR